MRGIVSFFSFRFYLWLLIFLIFLLTGYCFWKPLVLSSDSAYGFLSYRGSLNFHSFNVIPVIPTGNINETNLVFISWWSPGQWIYPGALNYFLGLRLGVAAICITIFSLVAGLIGYYRVFSYFKFPPLVCVLSLIVIFSGATLNNCLIIYQGGEIIAFAFFPWFILYVVGIHRVSFWNIVVVTVLFFTCFIAKTTLLIYCSLVLIARMYQLASVSGAVNRFRWSRSIWLMLPVFLVLGSVGILYLSRGPRPTLMNQFNISAESILIPLTSTFSSIASIQVWADRMARFTSGSGNVGLTSPYIFIICYLVILFVFVIYLRLFIRDKSISPEYKSLFFILLAGLIGFFLFAYSFGALIDFNARHFKLLGFLFIPFIVTILLRVAGPFFLTLIMILLCVLSMVDFFYEKGKWVKDRYISVNYFYRNYEFPASKDKLDETSYHEILKLDSQFVYQPAAIFFIESTGDVAIDIHHPFILQRPGDNIRKDIFRKSGKPLVICIAKSTLSHEKGILPYKFPDYRFFKQISETDNYLFLRGE